MSTTKTKARPKRFEELRRSIDASPARLARVREHKAAMLADLRHALDLTQAAVADRLDVSQENVSQIERAEANVRLSTLNRYVEALGGKLEISAKFPKQTVSLRLGDETVRRRRTAKAKTGRSSAKKMTSARGSAKRAASARKVTTMQKAASKAGAIRSSATKSSDSRIKREIRSARADRAG
jgi:transcriptional regulator with XRE-family HTH domain